MPQVDPVCRSCSRYRSGRSCEAFRKIPKKIWSGRNKHDKPLRGDSGKVFLSGLEA